MLPRARGIESLRRRLRERRERLFGEFSELWRDTAPTWVELERSLDRHTFSLQRGESGGDQGKA